ncbi:MAG TPA: hypothetical protein VNL97_07115 [Solirubrobacterales bacterium]|jgi:hypothetical protein|nr:hypothetical protein [Solirubrobacterales bacterium]
MSEAERKGSTMSNQPDTDPRPAAEGEPLKLTEMKRSAGHVAVQAVETIAAGAGVTLGGLAAKDAYDQAKDKLGLGGSKSDDSKD